MIDAPQDQSAVGGSAGDPAAARERLEEALDRGTADAVGAVAPAAAPDPAAAAAAASVGYVTRAQEAGVLSAGDGAALIAPLADRLRTAETPVEARRRAERAIEWARSAARRRGGREGRRDL